MSNKDLPIEKTLIILKPDSLKRGLVGKIFQTFENVGLKLLIAKMVRPNAQVIKNHYPGTTEWIEEMGKKTLASFSQSKLDVKKSLGTDHPHKLGQFVYDRLVKYWMEGPIIVSVWEGPHAVEVARKIRGHTIPLLANPGTLHAHFSYDSSPLSSSLDRVVKTFIHTSGNTDEANREIKYWFGDIELKTYQRDIDKLYLK